MLERMWRKGTLLHCWWECELVQPLWKTVWRFLKQLKIYLPYDPAIALLGIYPKDTNAMKRRDTCTPMFIAAMATIAKLWKSLGVQRKMNGNIFLKDWRTEALVWLRGLSNRLQLMS